MHYRNVIATAILAIAVGGWSSSALAQGGASARASIDPFTALVGKRVDRQARRAPEIRVERYVIATDDRAFLFENRGQDARLMFLCRDADTGIDCLIDPDRSAEEIHALQMTTGPRGDRIFRNETGAIFLRIASYGGATVHWPGETNGQAASRSFGDETSLRLPFADVETAQRRALSASAYVSAALGTPILFEIAGRPQTDEVSGAGVLADAIVRVAKGLIAVADDDTGAGAEIIARRIDRVILMPAEAPELSLDGKNLEIRYRAGSDLSGRPSSAAVARFLEDTL